MNRFFTAIITILVAIIICINTQSFALDSDDEAQRELIESAIAMRKAGIVKFNLRDIDVTKFIAFMSELIGENIKIASPLKQKITIIDPNPVTVKEAWKIMLSALHKQGLYLREIDGYYTIVERFPNTAGTLGIEAVKTSDDVIVSKISASLFKALMDNPLDEFKRIRMRPNDNIGGFEVQWIQNDSILKRLGVQRGDTITNINAIRIVDVKSFGEIINSLLEGKSFDIWLVRKGSGIKLINIVQTDMSPKAEKVSGDINVSSDIVI